MFVNRISQINYSMHQLRMATRQQHRLTSYHCYSSLTIIGCLWSAHTLLIQSSWNTHLICKYSTLRLHPWTSHLQIRYKPHGCVTTITCNSTSICITDSILLATEESLWHLEHYNVNTWIFINAEILATNRVTYVYVNYFMLKHAY